MGFFSKPPPAAPRFVYAEEHQDSLEVQVRHISLLASTLFVRRVFHANEQASIDEAVNRAIKITEETRKKLLKLDAR